MDYKRLPAAIVIFLLAIIFTAVQGRTVYDFNGGWRFFYGNDPDAESGQRITLPHTWNIDALAGDKEYYRGMGYYLNEADIPGEWSGRRVFIRFHGVNTVSNLYLNGRHVGEHKGGYSAFAYEITDFVQFGGRNVFWMAVNNAKRTDVLPVAGDQNVYGGIIRGVELIVTGREMISLADHGSEGLYVIQKNISPDLVEAEADVLVSGVRDGNVNVTLTVWDDEGNLVATESARVRLSGRSISTVKIPFAFGGPRLWRGTEDPYLYTVSATVTTDEIRTDSIAVKTGFRKVEISPEGPLLLNGTPYPVRGGCRQSPTGLRWAPC